MTRGIGLFDDGSEAVPLGVSGPVERVAVVGSGLAGLAVANSLTHARIDTVLLEARDRLGGRTYTVDFGGLPIDLGGSWIHSPGGNPLTRLSDQIGLRRVSGDFRKDMVFLESEKGRVPPAEQDQARVIADRVMDEIVDPDSGLDRTSPLDRVVAERVARLKMPERIAELVTRRLRMWVEAEGAAPWSDVAHGTVAPPADPGYEGDDIGDLIVGGYREVVDALSDGLDVRLESPVLDIEYDDGGVRVQTGDGAIEYVSHVVVTVPLGVLKGGSIQFSPGLPPGKLAAIERLGFGRFEKVVVRFATPFWTNSGVPHVSVLSDPDGSELRAIFGMDSAFPGQAVVVAFAFGHTSVNSVDTEAQRVARMVALLEEATGVESSPILDVVSTDWSGDPWALGAYTYIRPGQTHQDVIELAEPVGGRVLFAGEATSPGRAGFADGALSSGIREAKRLLGTPEVSLGRL